jgi:hypothetical protein
MANIDNSGDRPPLSPSDVYRPRLGVQPPPLSRTAMSELRAWREATAQIAATPQPDRAGQA